MALDSRHMLHPFSDPTVGGTAPDELFVEGRGSYLVTAEGNRLFDGNAGLWCVNLGYGNDELIDAITRQLGELSYAQSFGRTSSLPAIELSSRLAEVAPSHLNRAFFGTGGSTANDTAVRIAHYYHKRRGDESRRFVISLGRAYHGSTLLSATLTRIREYHVGFHMLDALVHEGPVPNPYRRRPEESVEGFLDRSIDELESLILEVGPENLACLLMEPILGAGGVIVPPPGYHERVADLCRRHGLLLVADEVVTGFGRLGEFVASERRFGFSPDMVTLAKGMSSGYFPMSATLVSDEIHDVLSATDADVPPFSHGFTHSGHPVGCAAALKTMELIERDGILDHVRSVGPRFMERLRALSPLPLVGEVRGMDFMAAVELVADKETKVPLDEGADAPVRLQRESRRRGLIIRPLKDYVILSPPLIMTADEADWVAEVVGESIVAVAGELGLG